MPPTVTSWNAPFSNERLSSGWSKRLICRSIGDLPPRSRGTMPAGARPAATSPPVEVEARLPMLVSLQEGQDLVAEVVGVLKAEAVPGSVGEACAGPLDVPGLGAV